MVIIKKDSNLADAFLVSFAKCNQLDSSGGSVENAKDFLLCKRCFEFYINPLISQFIWKEAIGSTLELKENYLNKPRVKIRWNGKTGTEKRFSCN